MTLPFPAGAPNIRPQNARYWQRRAMRAEAELAIFRQRVGRDVDVCREQVHEIIDLRDRIAAAIAALNGELG